MSKNGFWTAMKTCTFEGIEKRLSNTENYFFFVHSLSGFKVIRVHWQGREIYLATDSILHHRRENAQRGKSVNRRNTYIVCHGKSAQTKLKIEIYLAEPVYQWLCQKLFCY